jgi:hypothetical protein
MKFPISQPKLFTKALFISIFASFAPKRYAQAAPTRFVNKIDRCYQPNY